MKNPNDSFPLTPDIYPKISETIHNEAEIIWHITELLSKAGDDGSDEVSLPKETLRYFTKEISLRLGAMIEVLDSLVPREED